MEKKKKKKTTGTDNSYLDTMKGTNSSNDRFKLRIMWK